MNRSKIIYLTLSLILVFISCKEKVKETVQEDPQYLEVMEIHDAVMPEMANIHRIKRELKAIQKDHTDASQFITENIKALDYADEAMMGWMAEFKMPENDAEKAAYLEKEKQKIQAVSDEMYAAIRAGSALLDSLQGTNKILK
jgi:hypothetical protein